eukprot:TRINITY_DN4638_c0_g1_i2.p1 TRINITY_DN4638_c0_g1~~TRINITY_DN4638_c0_g1_i2.p1  ORF type:complete len:166 (+),score=35.76 TRINITY_DN4638_c0_g1_i2:146-643(+)
MLLSSALRHRIRQSVAATTQPHSCTRVGASLFSRLFTAPPPDAEQSDKRQPGGGFVDGKLAMVFTCKVCQTRQVKVMSKQAYYNGCVIFRCQDCQNLHLISDNIGYFTGVGTIKQKLEESGQNIIDAAGVMELTPEQLIGQEKMKSLGLNAAANTLNPSEKQTKD